MATLSKKQYENKRKTLFYHDGVFGFTPEKGGIFSMKGEPLNKTGGVSQEVYDRLIKEGRLSELDKLFDKEIMDGFSEEAKKDLRKFISWKGTPKDPSTGGKLTPLGLLNLHVVSCGTINSQGWGRIYKLHPMKEADIIKQIELTKKITYHNLDYLDMLKKVSAWAKDNPTKEVFIFADPPYPEGEAFVARKATTYGITFNQVELEQALYEIATKHKNVKILVTNGYEPWLGNYLAWRKDKNCKPFWNLYTLRLASRGGKSTKERLELLYTSYLAKYIGSQFTVEASHPKPDYTLATGDSSKAPEGAFKCMPQAEWESINKMVDKEIAEWLKCGGGDMVGGGKVFDWVFNKVMNVVKGKWNDPKAKQAREDYVKGPRDNNAYYDQARPMGHWG
jgi:hypothetical protein